MGREVSCTSARHGKALAAKESVWIGDIADSVRTGDVVLFSSKHRTSDITKFFTSSRWDHVGIVVKPSPSRAYLVEWGNGLFACEMVERLNEYAEWDAVDVVLRRLNLGADGDRKAVEERIEKFVDMLFREKMGQNRGVPFGEVVRAARDMRRKSYSYSKDTEVVVDNLQSLFCSKTVAVTYKAAGLLAPNRDSSKFLPRHFSSTGDGFLDLQGGATLDVEQRVTFESRRLHDAVANVLSLPLIEVLFVGPKSDDEKSAIIIEKFVRRLYARRELRRRKALGARKMQGSSKQEPLFRGADHFSTKERAGLLRRVSLSRRPKPRDTLQVTWIDPEQPLRANSDDLTGLV